MDKIYGKTEAQRYRIFNIKYGRKKQEPLSHSFLPGRFEAAVAKATPSEPVDDLTGTGLIDHMTLNVELPASKAIVNGMFIEATLRNKIEERLHRYAFLNQFEVMSFDYERLEPAQ